jgi:hypothetical protein
MSAASRMAQRAGLAVESVVSVRYSAFRQALD